MVQVIETSLLRLAAVQVDTPRAWRHLGRSLDKLTRTSHAAQVVSRHSGCMLDEYSEAGGRGPHAAGPDRFLPVTPAAALRLMLLALGLALTLAAVGLAGAQF